MLNRVLALKSLSKREKWSIYIWLIFYRHSCRDVRLILLCAYRTVNRKFGKIPMILFATVLLPVYLLYIMYLSV